MEQTGIPIDIQNDIRELIDNLKTQDRGVLNKLGNENLLDFLGLKVENGEYALNREDSKIEDALNTATSPELPLPRRWRALDRLASRARKNVTQDIYPIISNQNEDITIRVHAIDALAEINSASSIEKLVDLLSSKDEEVYCAAARALGEMKAFSAIKSIISTMESFSGKTTEGLKPYCCALEEIYNELTKDNRTIFREKTPKLPDGWIKWWKKKETDISELNERLENDEKWEEINIEEESWLNQAKIYRNYIEKIKFINGKLWAACPGAITLYDVSKASKIEDIVTNQSFNLYHPSRIGEFLGRRGALHWTAQGHVINIETAVNDKKEEEVWIKTHSGLTICSSDGKKKVSYSTDKEAIEGNYNNILKNTDSKIWPVDSDYSIWLHYKYYKGIRKYTRDKTWRKLDLKCEAKIERPSFLKDEPINILSIIQTKHENTIWISTDEGLFRFNDYKWNYFTDKHSPCFNARIGVSLWELPDGTIFARNDEGLAKYKGNDQWETIKEGWVNAPFLYDNEKNLWAVSKDEFIVFGKQGNPRTVSTTGLKDVDYLQNHIRDIFSIDEKTNWFCADDILLRYDNGKWESHITEDILPGPVLCAAKDPLRNRVWFGTANGLYFLDQ